MTLFYRIWQVRMIACTNIRRKKAIMTYFVNNITDSNFYDIFYFITVILFVFWKIG